MTKTQIVWLLRMNMIFSKFPLYNYKCRISSATVATDILQFARKFVAPRAGFLQYVFMSTTYTNLDDRDHKILSALSEDAWQSYVELGKIVHLSPSATQRRVEKLKALGVIKGARAIIDPSVIRRQLYLCVLIELQDEASDKIEKFRKCLSVKDGVVEAHYVAGVDDIVIILKVENMSQFVHFAEQNLNDNPNVKKYKTLTSMKKLF